MKLKKVTRVVFAVAFAAGPVLARSTEAPPVQANQQTVYTDPANGSKYQNVGQMGTPKAVAPPTGWKDLSGKVQSYDRTSQTLQLRDKAGNLYLVPMDNQVAINRKGKAVQFAELNKGDAVTLHMNR